MLRQIPTYSCELGLDLRKPGDRIKWFLASMLFAKRISASIARKTYLAFEAEGLVTPDAIIRAGWDKLVEVLDRAGYVRYDFSTASTLLETMEKIKMVGGLERFHDKAKGPEDLERKLQELKGIGLVASNIFLRELRGIWSKAKPEPSKIAVGLGNGLGLNKRGVEKFESALVRIYLEYCKRGLCDECPVNSLCRKKKGTRTSKPRI